MREQRGIFDAVLYKKMINQTGLRNYLYEESAPIFPRKTTNGEKTFTNLLPLQLFIVQSCYQKHLFTAF